MYSGARDIKSEVIGVYALAATNATAGGAGDATAANGATIDTTAFATRYNAVAFQIGARGTLGAAATLTVAAKIQTSANGSDWTDATAAATVLTLTGGAGGTTETGVGVVGLDLAFAQRYLRVVATPDLSAADTDTATIFGLAVFGGAEALPAA